MNAVPTDDQVLARVAQRRLQKTATIAEHFGVGAHEVLPILERLERSGKVSSLEGVPANWTLDDDRTAPPTTLFWSLTRG